MSVPAASRAQPALRLIYDVHQSGVFGAQNLISAQAAAYTLQDRLIPDTLFRERNLWLKGAGFGYRMLKIWLLDAQIDYLLILAQHEMFGHGARYREMGHRENSFHLSLFFPYGDGSGFARSGTLIPGARITPQERISEIIGGNESNQVLARELSAPLLLEDRIHYRQAMLYLGARNNLPAYIWRTRLLDGSGHISAGDDIASYLMEINSLYAGTGHSYTLRALSEQTLISLLDPLQAYALYTILVTYGVKGKKALTGIPMIRMGKLRYLPALNFSLTPFGSCYHLEQHFVFHKRLLTADFSYGDRRFSDFFGLHLRGYRLVENRWITLHSALAGWRQPKIEEDLWQVREFRNRWGGMVQAELCFHPFRIESQPGLFLQLGYKSSGFLPGEAVGEGIILRFGFSGKL